MKIFSFLLLIAFKVSNAGFADSLIATESQQIGCKLWTFDRKLSHQENVCRLV